MMVMMMVMVFGMMLMVIFHLLSVTVSLVST